MEKVVLDETEYVKASAVAKEFNYTSDYIGQLCRAKKVDARLVGRSWFVNIESLLEHRRNKYSTTQPASKSQAKEMAELTEIANNIKTVAPVLKSKTARQAFNNPERANTRTLKVSYEADEESLIPEINKSPQDKKPKTISVKAFKGKHVRVKGGEVKNTVDLVPSELPEVALSGKLEVKPLEDSEEKSDDNTSKTTRDNHKNNVLSAKPDKKSDQDNRTNYKKSSKEQVSPPAAEREPVPAKSKKVISLRRKKSKRAGTSVTFSPQSVSNQATPPTQPSSFILASPLFATLVAIVCVGVIFSASTHVSVTSDTYYSAVQFQVATLLEILK